MRRRPYSTTLKCCAAGLLLAGGDDAAPTPNGGNDLPNLSHTGTGQFRLVSNLRRGAQAAALRLLRPDSRPGRQKLFRVRRAASACPGRVSESGLILQE